MKSFRKKTKTFLNFDTPVISVKVGIEYNLTIHLGREIKTINIKDLI